MGSASASATAATRLAAAIADADAGVSCWRNPTCGHAHLELSDLNALRFHQPGDLTVGADAGMTVSELNARLASAQQWLPLDVPRPETTTLGAVLACHRSGPLRHRFGTVRDFTIGLEMATAQGQLVHSGGRVVKNVAGYDWMKCAIGARGAFGILTGVNFRVFTPPGRTITASLPGLFWPQVEALRHALRHSPLHPLAFELWRPAGAPPTVHVRCSGSDAVLARYRRELDALASHVDARIDWIDEPAGEAALWRPIEDFPQPGERSVALPPAEAVAALAALPDSAPISGRLGLGVFFIRGAALERPQPSAGERLLMDRLKRALDPNNRCHGEACA